MKTSEQKTSGVSLGPPRLWAAARRCCFFRSERIFLLGHPSGNTLIGKSSGMTLIGKTNHHTNNLRKPYRKKKIVKLTSVTIKICSVRDYREAIVQWF